MGAIELDVFSKIMEFLFRRHEETDLPDLRYSDPSHAQYDPSHNTQGKQTERPQSIGIFPRNQNHIPPILGKNRHVSIPPNLFHDTDKINEMTISCLKEAGSDGLSGRQINEMICSEIVGGGNPSRAALANKDIREILSNIRTELRKKGQIGFNSRDKVWYINKPIALRDLSKQEERFLASKGLETGWHRIDNKIDAIKWLHSNLTWFEFEGFCISILKAHCGVPITITQKRKSGADGGFDGEGTMLIDGKIENIALQAKQYAFHNYVGEDHLAAFVGALNIRGWNHGFMVTTSLFSDRVKASAETLKSRNIWIELIDQERLANIMLEKRNSVHGFGLHQTDIGMIYMNEGILRWAANQGGGS